MPARKPLTCWSGTIAENYNPLPPPERMDSIWHEFTMHWCYQGEICPSNKKRHNQSRFILSEPQRLETLLTIFEARGFDRRDLTFLPESNKSIQQGGLAFYVMDDSKELFHPFRCDSAYKQPRSINWIPRMCHTIRDNPRPWMTSLNAILADEPHHRAIIWVCTLDGLGGVGKSLYCAYLEATHTAIYIGDGTPTQIKESVISEGEHRAYTCDMPMTFAKDNRLGDYINAIETVKNGFIKTGMHGKRKKLLMDQRPHFVCFANCLPPFSMMTNGRYHLYTVDPNKPHDQQTLDPGDE